MTTTSDIVVRRCAVRVVRHGGWSWGPQPRRLVDQVLAALPGLIAERLGTLALEGGPDMEITEPVRIAVSLTLADLLAGRFDPRQHAAAVAEPLPAPSPVPESASPRSAAHGRGTLTMELTPPRHAQADPMKLAQFLVRVYQRGELGKFLALLPTDTLEAWYQSLTARPIRDAPGMRPWSAAPSAMPADSPPGGAGHPATAMSVLSPGATAAQETARSRQLREAITAIAAQAARGSTADRRVPDAPAAGLRGRQAPAGPTSADPRHPHTAAAESGVIATGTASDWRVPDAPAAGLRGRQAPAGPTSADPRHPHTAATVSGVIAMGTASASGAAVTHQVSAAARVITQTRSASTPEAADDAEVSSALPFLLLGPLAHTGYLSALAPALEPVGLETQTAAFATALAYTVLGPLERGWRRQPEDLAAAAAFAGLGAPLPAPVLTEFARVVGPALPALDAVVTQALAEGHTAGEPLVLAGAEVQAGGGLLLLDREGLFPIAWTDTAEGLLPAWRLCGSPPVLVAPTALGALRKLAAVGAIFVVATPPDRGESWRRLLPHRLWTNDHENPTLARHASGYREAVDLTAGLIEALAAERAAVPLAVGPALTRSLLLAAGLGLGTLAWTLWREREPADPLLTLERFANLSARVSFEPNRVRVRLPLGPRHSDLSVHGLLADVHGVPWFGGRVVEFSGG